MRAFRVALFAFVLFQVGALAALGAATPVDAQAGSPLTMKLLPVTKMPLVVFAAPLGTKGTIAFDVPVEIARIEKAQLALNAGDFDDRRELSISFNGSAPLAIPDALIGNGRHHPGAIDLPLDSLRKGRNEATFTFTDNLDGTTKGFGVEDAYLLLALADDAAAKPKSTAADVIEHRGDAPVAPPVPTPALVLRKGGVDRVVPSLFCDGRFFVKLSDVAKVTGDGIDADMVAPVNQALTYLGYQSTYDESAMKDASNPRTVVTVGDRATDAGS